MEYYVYIYFDPRSIPPTPIYVGKGKGNRYRHHVIKKTQNLHFSNKLKKIKEAGLEPLVEFAIQDVSNDDAMKMEIELIAKHGRADKKQGPLCNWTDGGEGTAGYKHSEETKQLFSEQRKGKKQTEAQYKANCSRVMNDEARAKQSLANKGHSRHTPESIEKLRLANIGKKKSDKTRTLMSEQRKGKKQTEAQYKANCARIPKTKKVKCLNTGVLFKV